MRIFSIQAFNQSKSAMVRLFVFVLLLASMLAQEHVPGVQAQAGTPQLILTKTIEGGATTASLGDTIRYRIRFECSSLTTSCGQMEITDVLPAGLTYAPPPASSAPTGFTITEAPAGTITITKDDNNLLDGTQYDVVIAATIDYDLRPLPATINNTVNGRVDPPGAVSWQNATPASAPPITVSNVGEYWDLTKTLYSPSVNPTINTDVTYRIQLCPTTPPPGTSNVALENITITDTLPTGATFVSASDAGTEAAGVVTWPLIAGPVFPPTCVTRYVTIRYNSPTFAVGNNVTNTANASGTYTDSGGGTIGPISIATDPITHPIATVLEVPTYSKNDQGDPVGITGTARFVLTLNTNGTNSPANDLILIDTLPPQLQVTSVTSGQWNAAFNYVRAYVEYSTNYGSSYTAFPGQPISYNSNATYTAPAANITNVRWRFEYDPDAAAPFSFTQAGLPFAWAFTTSPQIRVTPRATATTADAPSGVAMPAAVAGTRYENCLQTSRTSNAGAPVTDPCDIEGMTVQGTLASLRASKAETRGTSWDADNDPLINTFTSDSTLLPGDTLRYTITVSVTERSSQPMIDPTILDTIPADLIFVRNGTASVSGTGCPALASQPTFTQAGTQLKWDFTGLTLNHQPSGLGSCNLVVEFYARIPAGQTPGTRTNDLILVTDSDDIVCENGTEIVDTTDIDSDANNTEPACQNPDTYVVERSAALRGEKWIRSVDPENSVVVDSTTFQPSASCPDGGTVGLAGGGSNPFTRFPCISQAFPEGALSIGQRVPPPLNPALDDFEYNLRIYNDGNVEMLSYALYDIFPYYGDTGSGGTLANSPRLTEFRPILRGPVEFISGPSLSSTDFTIEYNNTTNPCRPEVFNQPAGTPNIPAGCNNTWSSTWSADARSFRILLNSPAVIPPSATTSEVRFGIPMYIPKDAPTVGVFDNNDPLSLEIAWNSFSHVGSYDSDPNVPVVIQDLLASEPRKVGITIPERMSVGNRVWRDSDNSGHIDAPDDIAPGIAGVTVNLYRDVDDDGVPDGPAIATTTTDSLGYYLFSNIPHDLADVNNNRYLIGIPSSNFGAGQPLFNLRSSTGVFATTDDSDDNGIDPVTTGQEVFSASFILQPTTEVTGETDLSSNDLDGPPGERRGTNAERDYNSDLAIDFGFFGGTDVPFSIGNHVWFDNGRTGASTFNYALNNDGIRQATELPVVGLDIRLYRDGNGNNTPEPAEMIRTDITDANGFYLFDNLDPGPYIVEIPASEFGAGQPLEGWNNSQVIGTETTGVPGNTNIPNVDSDDNGVDSSTPHVDGIFSGVIVLTRGTNETTGETHISNQPDPDGNAATPNLGINPTEWDGPASRGRYGESDTTSNLTIDFGFFEVYSLGNVVWVDDGTGGGTADDGLRNGTEPGLNGVTVNLYLDANNDGRPDTVTPKATTTTANGGYYRFDNLAADTYLVEIVLPAGYSSSPIDAGDPDTDEDDFDDNGVVPATISTVLSNPVTLGRGTDEPTVDSDAATANNPEPGEAPNHHSNRTVDFALTLGYSLGNRVWVDLDDSGTINAADGATPGLDNMTVNLYRSSDPSTIIATTLTAGGGYYRFDNLLAGDYIVEVVSPVGYTSSSVDANDPNTDNDSDDNGVIISATTVRSNPVSLGGIEPSTDDDPLPNPAATGEAPNARSNRTVDFGFFFVPYSLGNRVWDDSDGAGGTPDNGVRDGAEPGIDGVTVNLYRDSDNNNTPDGAIIATDTTSGGGFYRFDNLAADTYIVEVIPPAGYTSTLDAGDPDTDLDDDDDNGVVFAGANIRSNPVRLGPPEPSEPTLENNPAVNPETADGEAADDHSNRTVDFGFVLGYSLGNRVWDDSNGAGGTPENGLRDGTEPGMDGVTVNLYRDSNDDSNPDGGIIMSTSTSGGGFYRFDNLMADTYIVEVVIPTGYTSTLDAGDPDTDIDDDDNGVVIVGSNVRANPVTLGPAAVPEPTLENNPATNPVAGESPDARSNRTVDFGFIRSSTPPPPTGSGIQIVKTASASVVKPGDTVVYSYVVSNTGTTPLRNVIVTDDKCSPVTYISGDVNANNILETTEKWNYTCSAILSETTTNIATVTGKDPTGGDVKDTDTVTVTVDTNGFSKIITGTSETFTNGMDVAIGEIVTYKITMSLPAGLPYNNVVVTDRMDKGLAFVDCVSATLGGVDILNQICPPLVSAIKDPIDPASNPANPGRQAQFNIGNVSASTKPTALVITYRAIVLDVIENQEKDTLNNKATLTWDGGSLTASAPEVVILEPDLDIEKAANPTTVTAGSSVEFTIFITHTSLSLTDAFDVVVTDVLPKGLEYVACTPITYEGVVPTKQPDPCNIPNGDTLQFEWDVLPLGGNSVIKFFARYDGSQVSVMNSAAVAWTSLPIDYINGKPVQLSEYNDTSTERWYDPNDLVNIYQISDNVWINPPTITEPIEEEELPGSLPATGFAPNVITALPQQPANKAYTTTDIWVEIPSIGVNMPIVGVPLVDGDWDLSWLWNEAGWLNGTAFPGWDGNSALTGHITLPNGRPGPFAMLGNLKWGDKIIVHAYGTAYTYEVRETRTVSPDNMTILKHEEESWLTLITCKTYDKATNTYARRTAVRAVLISTTADKQTKEAKSGR